MRSQLVASVVIRACGMAAASTASHFRTLLSEHDSSLAIRVHGAKPNAFCRDTAGSYAGYIDVADSHLFYWYQPVEHETPDTPVIVWVQGASGESSLIGALLESGACTLDERGRLGRNDNTWTKAAHVVYLDPFPGVGYSYKDESASPETSPLDAAKLYIITAIKMLQRAFPTLSGRALHLGGEGFGAGLLVQASQSILDYNDWLPESLQNETIHLESLVIGNGVIHAADQLPALFETGCTSQYGIEPIFNSSFCRDDLGPRALGCMVSQDDCVRMSGDPVVCETVASSCLPGYASAIHHSGRQTWDRTKSFDGEDPNIPSPLVQFLSKIMESEWFQTALFGDDLAGVHSHGPINNATWPLGTTFGSAIPGLTGLLEHAPTTGVFLYYGVRDWMAAPGPAIRALDNHLGGVPRLRWTLESWEDMKNSDGRVKVAGEGFMFAEFSRAGRLVAFDQGKALLNSVSNWLTRHTDKQPLSLQPDLEDGRSLELRL